MILVDPNVLLDVVQHRHPHYRASAAVIDEIVHARAEGALRAHAVPTADGVVDWLIRYFAIAAVDRAVLPQALLIGWRDFQDTVVAVPAQRRHCRAIVTRNVADFPDSPIAAVTPEEYLMDWS